MTANLKNLEVSGETVDGISFSLVEDGTTPESQVWNLTMMKLNNRENENFVKNDLGYMYQILLYQNGKAEIFEAIIGDLKYYIDGLMRINQEGLIIKKCNKSEEILNKIFNGRLNEALTAGLVYKT